MNVGTVLDITKETHIRLLCTLIVGTRNGLVFLVIGRNAITDQSEGSRQTVVQINPRVDLFELLKVTDGVKPSWTCTDDSNSQWVFFTAYLSHGYSPVPWNLRLTNRPAAG